MHSRKSKSKDKTISLGAIPKFYFKSIAAQPDFPRIVFAIVMKFQENSRVMKLFGRLLKSDDVQISFELKLSSAEDRLALAFYQGGGRKGDPKGFPCQSYLYNKKKYTFCISALPNAAQGAKLDRLLRE